MAHIFISHAEEDARVAKGLAQLLSDAGYTTWHYQRDSRLGPNYLAQVARAVEEAGAVILIISRNAFRSHHVDREITRAIEYRKPFIPLLYKIKHEEFQKEKPEWSFALGATVSLPLPAHNIPSVVPEVVGYLEKLNLARSDDVVHVPRWRRLWERANLQRLRIAAAALCALAALALLLWVLLPASAKIRVGKPDGMLLAGKYDTGKDDVVYTFDVEITNYSPEEYTIADVSATLETPATAASKAYRFTADKCPCNYYGTQNPVKFEYRARPRGETVKITCHATIQLKEGEEALQMKEALLSKGVRQVLTVTFTGGDDEEDVGRLKFCFNTAEWPFSTEDHNGC